MKHAGTNEHGTTSPPLHGLSTHEVEARHAAGKGAVMPPPTGRTYAQIIREDVFPLINTLLFTLCAALFLLGQISAALVSAGTVLFNVLVSVVQEIRAKRALDRIALLTRPRATVMREGREQTLDPGELDQATRGIAGLVLLGDSFATLPLAFAEGQRIRNGMESAMKLLLTRVLYLALLLLTIPMLGAFPFAPKQKALVTFETIGIMAVALAAWTHPGPPSRRGVGRLLLHFALPAAVSVSLIAFAVCLLAFFQALQQVGTSAAEAQLLAQSALTAFAVCSGLLLVKTASENRREPSSLWRNDEANR